MAEDKITVVESLWMHGIHSRSSAKQIDAKSGAVTREGLTTLGGFSTLWNSGHKALRETYQSLNAQRQDAALKAGSVTCTFDSGRLVQHSVAATGKAEHVAKIAQAVADEATAQSTTGSNKGPVITTNDVTCRVKAPKSNSPSA